MSEPKKQSTASQKYLPLLIPAAAGIILYIITIGSTVIVVMGIIALLLLVLATIMAYKVTNQLAKLHAENETLSSKIRNDEVFVDIATSASMPKFVINGDGKPYWTNIKPSHYNLDQSPEEIVKLLVETPAATAAIEKCLKRNLIAVYEVEMGNGENKSSLNITLSKIKYQNNEDAICGNITNISEHQRELSMQAEMLSLITAQMEVQQAAIKEQNDVLSEQHKQLEEQAQKLTEAFQELEIRNKQITTKTNYITDSIKYAQTIQQAMLPGKEQMLAFFDNFIVYRPKDIVSGDFYWLSMTPEYTFAAVGDCTGHGVPGAFMSMIGIRLLGELINENKIYNTSIILETMHEKINSALKQDVSENNDGMDIAICRFKRVQGEEWQWEMQYSGAKQPIFIYRKATKEVETVEADRRGIGGESYAEVFFFNEHTVHLYNGDRIYMTTDGIKDQNNIMRKRFGTARVKTMLATTYTEKIEDQKMFVDTLLNNWQGLEEQRDDISLWGYEISDKIF
ncbi:MAG: SpoIIE family protein phosphatase [Bacteroidales bacterium]|nr:SpoIIE family protein phosphatase [Bacteroidales bacterium]